MFNLFRRKSGDNQLKETIEAMQRSLKISFENIKKDFSTIDKHHKVFHEKHEKHEQRYLDHEEKLRELHERLLVVESLLKAAPQERQPVLVEEFEDDLPENELDSMTEVSQKICYILAALAQENKEMVTLKTLAEEMYPGKDYQKIRSTISQYTTELEELGFVQKKKRGRHVYIKSTEKNPFLKEKIILKKKVKNKS